VRGHGGDRAKDLAFGPLLLASMAQEILGHDVLDADYH
jgi:hypothetical protein